MDHFELKAAEKKNDQAIESLVAKCQKQKCPVCDNTWWKAGRMLELPHYTGVGGGGNIHGMVVVTISCNGCGNTLFFDAKAVGIETK